MTRENQLTSDFIEILPVSLLDTERNRVTEFTELADKLGLGIGWHYHLDWSWTAKQLGKLLPGSRFLDAGAGGGLMQFWLAQQGITVISVDRQNRRNFPVHLRQQFRIKGLRKQDLAPLPAPEWRDFFPSRHIDRWNEYPEKLSSAFTKLQERNSKASPESGTIFIYEKNLDDLVHVKSNTIDNIISISSLEHNTPEGLANVVEELIRILKPGGKLIATLAAAKDEDWFHEPSSGWCYTEKSLRKAFNLPDDTPSNYEQHDQLMDQLINCEELKNSLRPFYFESGDNGMPWGKWDPTYQPVGVVKVKR